MAAFREIVVALDGSPEAELVLGPVTELARAFGSRITLVRAVLPPTALLAEPTSEGIPPGGLAVDPEPILEAEETAATAYLGQVAQQLTSQGFTVATADPEGTPPSAIVDLARQGGADLIAMATHGRSGLAHLLLGSTAEDVVRHAPCPVLLVRVTEPG